MKRKVCALLLTLSTHASASVQMDYLVRDGTRYVALARFEPIDDFPFQQLFLDLDGDPATGYPFGGLGADYLVEGDRLYRYVGPGWNWQEVASLERVQKGSTVQWWLPADRLGSPTSVVAVAAGRRSAGTWEASGQRSSADFQIQTASLYATGLQERKGSRSEQPLSVLRTGTLQGTEDVWEEYIEFYPERGGYLGIFTFDLPAGLPASHIASLSVEANYRGQEKQFQRWLFKLRDFSEDRWHYLGDNQSALDWRWSRLTFSPPLAPLRFVNDQNQLKLRFRTPKDEDVGQLDLLRIKIHKVVPASQSGGGDPGIWRPEIGDRWQLQLQGTIDTSVDAEIFEIDLFDTPASTIDQLHQMGKKVVCYFSAGSYENWRPDADQFPPEVLGNPLDGWPGEWWLDIRRIDLLKPIMTARLDLAVQKGCDAVDPDNVNGYQNNTGFPLTAQDQIQYNRMLAQEAHARGLAVALKNALGLVSALVSDFDFAVNESCFLYNECGLLQPFLDQGKAVLGVSYVDDPAQGPAKASQICPQANARSFSWLIKTWDLGSWRIDCHDD